MGHAQVAQRVRELGIDILVDLKGATYDAPLPVLAARPAPLQVTWLGFPGTTGAPYIDYLIGDPVVTPLEHAGHFAEKIAQMPLCYQPNDARRERPQPSTRADWGVPEDGLLLCGFHQSYKISEQVFELWCALLRERDDALLWLLQWNTNVQDTLRAAARARGIDPQRLLFAPLVPLQQHLSRLACADLYLDAWPCNAHTTAGEALWVGVPVVTLQGQAFAQRVASSLLHAVQLDELVCHDAGRLPQYGAGAGGRCAAPRGAAAAPGRAAAMQPAVRRCRVRARPRGAAAAHVAAGAAWRAAAASGGCRGNHEGVECRAAAAGMRLAAIAAGPGTDIADVGRAASPLIDIATTKEPPMRLPSVHLCIVQPLGYVHSLGFLDQARFFRHQFRRMGAEVSLAKNRLRHDAVNFVFGAHLGFDEELRSRYTCVFVNLEQLGTGGATVSPAYLKLLGHAAVVDYDAANVRVYTAHVEDVPLVSFAHAPYLEGNATPIEDRPIDILFFGSLNPRREQLIKQVESSGRSVTLLSSPVYGPERDGLIRQAKVVLNCHFYDSARFEQARAFQCLSLGTPVVSEWTASHAGAGSVRRQRLLGRRGRSAQFLLRRGLARRSSRTRRAASWRPSRLTT